MGGDKKQAKKQAAYTAKDIDVLEGLEPVRRRPGMFVGGVDEEGLHHLAIEVLDNAMDEVLGGFARKIWVHLRKGGELTVRDDGRGIPVDPHPAVPDMSALEVIMTRLHAGGKFGSGAYETSGGLHGVGISVVNALSKRLEVEVVRENTLYSQKYTRGTPTTALKQSQALPFPRGTRICFLPDPKIFGEARLDPKRVYEMVRTRAQLFKSVTIYWVCDESYESVPKKDTLCFPGGLSEALEELTAGIDLVVEAPFCGESGTKKEGVEWALNWSGEGERAVRSFCNTVPTPAGGTHEQGLRNALSRGLRAYGELIGNKGAALITTEDATAGLRGFLSVFTPAPEFQGQTKEKLTSLSAVRLVEHAVRNAFEHTLADAPTRAQELLEHVITRAQERQSRKKAQESTRKSRRLRLPGKLADCNKNTDTELFIVEGDSAGGSAKQARDRQFQAVLPLRGKILNVVSASAAKKQQNQQLMDILQALGVQDGYREEALRYEKVIIMTDADVDGAHIASLLITFFYQEMPDLIRQKHLFLAVPPLYRLSGGGHVVYARDDAHRDQLLKNFKTQVEISRFKGLGEMLPAQLRETTMSRHHRTLLQVLMPKNEEEIQDTVRKLMGPNAEPRYAFIQENAPAVINLDI